MTDLTLAIVAMALIIIFCIPLLMNHFKTRKGIGELKTRMIELAKANGITIKDVEIWRRTYAMALDESSQKLVYLHTSKEESQVLDLTNFKSCKLAEVSRTIREKSENRKVIDKIDLVLVPLNDHEPPACLEIYDEAENFSLLGEGVMAVKWRDKVNEQLIRIHKGNMVMG